MPGLAYAIARRSPPRPTGTRSPARAAKGRTSAHRHTCGSALGFGAMGMRSSRAVHSGMRPVAAKSAYSSASATSSWVVDTSPSMTDLVAGGLRSGQSSGQPAERGRSLLDERLDALAEVGPPEALEHECLRFALGRTESRVQLLVHLTLHHGQRRRRAVRGEVGDVLAGRVDHAPVDRAIDETDALAFRAVDLARREQQVERSPGSDQAREQPARAPLGDQPALRERDGEHRVARHEPQVAGERDRARPCPAIGPLIAAMIGLGIDIRYV